MSMHISTYKMSSGERCAVLIDEFGMPLFWPTLYITAAVRNAAKSVATAEQCLAGIKILLQFCKDREIDLIERIRSECFFTIGEVDAIRDACQRKRRHVAETKIINLRKAYRSTPPRVATATTYLYLTRIAEYLKWLCRYQLKDRRFESQTSKKIESFVSEILTRRPRVPKLNVDDEALRGVSVDQESRLFEILVPGHPANPFRISGVQVRNYLMIKLLRLMGPRGGELLNIQISDFDFSKNQLRIVRRADAIEDHRSEQPRVKTRQRVLPLAQSSMDEVRYYIVEVRKHVPNAARDPYLFVSHGNGPTQGRAISISSLHEIFKTIGRSNPELKGVTAHDLRHRWHVAYSEAMDGAPGYSSDEIEQWRNFLAGWSENSKQAQRYAARHIRRKAHEAMLESQSQFEQKIRLFCGPRHE